MTGAAAGFRSPRTRPRCSGCRDRTVRRNPPAASHRYEPHVPLLPVVTSLSEPAYEYGYDADVGGRRRVLRERVERGDDRRGDAGAAEHLPAAVVAAVHPDARCSGRRPRQRRRRTGSRIRSRAAKPASIRRCCSRCPRPTTPFRSRRGCRCRCSGPRWCRRPQRLRRRRGIADAEADVAAARDDGDAGVVVVRVELLLARELVGAVAVAHDIRRRARPRC